MLKYVYCGVLASCIYIALFADTASAKPDEFSSTHRILENRCVSILWSGVRNGKQFEKVHAGEGLLWNGFSKGVKSTFLNELKTAELPYRIGVLRVLAQCDGRYERAKYIEEVRSIFLSTGNDQAQRETALETLGKIRDAQKSDALVRVAEAGDGTFKTMARWVLANSGKPKDEAMLAELLDSPDSPVRCQTGYCLRFLDKLRPGTLQKLEACTAREPVVSAQRMFLVSALYVHSPKSRRAIIKPELLKYIAEGSKDEKYEACLGLSYWANSADIRYLEPLLDDKELDVRISAANAILRILCHPKHWGYR